MARCEQVEYRVNALDGSAKIALAGVTIERGGLAHFHALLQQLLRRDRGNDLNLTVTADDIAIAGPVDTEQLAQFSGLIRTSDGDCEAALRAGTGDRRRDHRDRERKIRRTHPGSFVRSRASGTPKDKWELHTGRHSVPCEWFMAVAGDVRGLARSRLQGSIWVNDVATGQVAVRGRLTGIELAPAP